MKRVIAAVVFLALMCGGAWAEVKIDETNFPDKVFREYVSSNFDEDSNGTLSDGEIAAVTTIDVSGSNISSLQGVEYLTALRFLHCYDNQLTTLDVSNNTELSELKCYDNQLATLDVGKKPVLWYLDCSNNQLTTLDASGCTYLENLYCSSNQLTTLDLSNTTDLRALRCESNKLTTLDLSDNTELRRLRCESNKLTSLDVSKKTKLWYLDCSDNQLKILDVSDCANLESLDCSANQLKTLDVSGCVNLDSLDCSDNQLTTLDLSNIPSMSGLYCQRNRLTTLDLSGTTFLLPQVGSPLHLRFGPQEVFPLYITNTGNAGYPYQLNFSDYITSSDEIAKITDDPRESVGIVIVEGESGVVASGSEVQGFASDDTRISTTYADGIALFAARPAKVTYHYAVLFETSRTTVDYETGDFATETGLAQTLMDVTISGNPEPPVIRGTFPTGKLNEAYSESINVSSGNSPYTWSYEGTLPDGTELNQNTSGDTYTLSGTPTKAGDYSFTVSVIDSYYQTASKDITVTISADTPAPTPTPDPDPTPTPDPDPTPTPTPDPDPKPTPTPEDNNNNNTNNNTGNNTGDNTNENTGENTNTPTSLSLNALNNIAQSLGNGSSTPSYIPESNMAAEQTPTPEITRAVSSDGYQIVSTQGSLIVPVSGSYAFPISVPYHFIGTRTAAKVYLARRGFSVGMVVNPSELPEDLVEAQIFTEAGKEVTTLPETIIAAANLEVSGPTTFSTHLATKVESSSEFRGTTSGGGCNSGFAVLGVAVMLMFRKKSK